jgi:hypothetical protein
MDAVRLIGRDGRVSAVGGILSLFGALKKSKAVVFNQPMGAPIKSPGELRQDLMAVYEAIGRKAIWLRLVVMNWARPLPRWS